jgi:hypothetical protein
LTSDSEFSRDDAEQSASPKAKTPPPNAKDISASDLAATPTKHKPGNSERHSTSEGRKEDSPEQKMLWRKSLEENFRTEESIEDFLQNYLPQNSETNTTIDRIVRNSAKALKEARSKVKDASVENDYAPSFVS